MSMTKGTPASSQIITMERMLEEKDEKIAELEKERDEWKESAINGGNAGYLREKVAELEKERGYDPVTISENTMNKYRNAVIDECIEYSDCVSGEYLRGLKR